MRVVRRFLLVAALLVAGPEAAWARHQVYTPSITDYGGVGLLQTRSARFGDEGLFALGASFADPYYRYFISVHGLPGLEVGFRYTTIQNRGIGTVSPSGREVEFQDKGADIKLRLLQETALRPALAIGIQDFIGTAQFAGEYLVASKRYYDFDFSLGVGWGRLGTRGHFKNPLTLISDSFRSRSNRGSGDQGGNVSLGQFFAGPRVALFGGVEWLTPIEGLRLKLEYDPNNYTREPLENDLRVDSAFNVGLVYQPFPWVDLGVGLERGNTLMVRATVTPNLVNPKPVLRIDTPPAPVTPRAGVVESPGAAPRRDPTMAGAEAADRLFDGLAELGLTVQSVAIRDGEAIVEVEAGGPFDQAVAARVVETALPPPVEGVTIVAVGPGGEREETRFAGDTFALAGALGVSPAALAAAGVQSETTRRSVAEAIMAALEAERFAVEAVDIDDRSATLFVEQPKYRKTPQAVGRAARIVAAIAPAEIEEITVVHLNEGLETSRVTILRADLERAVSLRGSPEETYAHAVLTSGDGTIPTTAFRNGARYPEFTWGLEPDLRQHVGGVDAFYLYQLWLRASAGVRLNRSLSLHATVGKDIYNNFDKLEFDPGSRLPRVRSLNEDYLREGADNLVNLYASYVTNLGRDWYAAVTAGILEEMYAGISGEILYRPFNSRLAVGLDVSHVYQRSFPQLFNFFPYDTTTGHLSLYYQTPLHGLLATVRLGRYLARDIGATFELAREFEGGIILGAFASATNVSARDFGEGSFDKGLFVSIPLDIFFLHPTRERASFAFRPLTRDGGQFVGRPVSLYDLTGDDRFGRIVNDWSSLYD
ncbi:MAG: YjbH domain-containing protein [Alphaproteobacteria bacterium]